MLPMEILTSEGPTDRLILKVFHGHRRSSQEKRSVDMILILTRV